MKQSASKKPNILLIDDDSDLLELMRRKLEQEGCEATISQNGERINEMIATKSPDCILLDIHMEGINGTDICQRLKSQQPTCQIPVLLLSANDNIEKIAVLCNADGYIKKPMNVAMFVQKIKEIMKIKLVI